MKLPLPGSEVAIALEVSSTQAMAGAVRLHIGGEIRSFNVLARLGP